MSTIVRDITERKRMEDQLRDGENRLRSLIASLDDLGFTLDQDLRFGPFHQSDRATLFLKPEQFVGKRLEEIGLPEFVWGCIYQAVRETLQTRKPTEALYSLDLPQGSAWFEMHVTALETTAGTRPGVTCVVRDITARRRADEALRALLAEQTVLLKEVHHRVKNHLQIVSSLLDLQQRRTQDDQLLNTLASTRNRVRSMALIHEKLYQSDNLANLDLASHLAELCRQLHSSAGNVRNRVRSDAAVTPQNLAVGLDQAVPYGLVINELVSNALKYAFPGKRTGGIRVTLERSKPQEVLLTVADNGVDLPAALDPGHTNSLGLKLGFLLTRQLHGSVTFERASGTTVHIRFPNPSDTTS